MTKDEETYYNEYFDLFRSEGWLQILDELKDRADTHEISNIEDEKTLFRMKGELSIINMLLGFEALMERCYEDAVTHSGQPE
jgi:hypothetical protein